MADELVYVDDEIVGEIVPVERAEEVLVEHSNDEYTGLPTWTKVRVSNFTTNIPIPLWSIRASVPPGVFLTFRNIRGRSIWEYQNRTSEAQIFDLPNDAVLFSAWWLDLNRPPVWVTFEIAI